MLWRYVHRAVDSEEDKHALEEALRTEESMRRELQEIERTHFMLEKLMPRIDQSDDEMIDTVVQAWDDEQAANTHDEYTEPIPNIKGQIFFFLKKPIMQCHQNRVTKNTQKLEE